MANTITLKQWDGAIATATQYVTYIDDVFDDPYIKKKVYGLRITYQSTATATLDNIVSYTTDGGSTFGTAYVGTTVVPSTSGSWDIAYVDFSQPVNCQSIQVRLTFNGAQAHINDCSPEYRPIHKRVT